MPRGGPDGGDGGHGGDVVLVCDAVAAGSGGAEGEQALPGRARAARRRVATATGRGARTGRSRCRRGPRLRRSTASRVDLVEPGQRAVVAHGGRGGHGNKRFANSTRQAPRFAEKGTSGRGGLDRAAAEAARRRRAGRAAERGQVLAAGAADPGRRRRSPTTRSRRSRRCWGRSRARSGRRCVADIPGLIEGAAEGAGLGHEFLAHVERCAMLVHLVELAPLEGEPVANYEAVRAELSSYGAGLERLPELVVLSKRDLLPAERGRGGAWREWRRAARRATALGVLAVSSATGEGLDELRGAILAALPERRPARPASAAAASRGRVRGRAPRLPAGGRGRLLGRARGRRRLPRPRPRRRAALRAPRPHQRRGARLPRAAAQRDRRRRRPARRRLRARRRGPRRRARVRAASVTEGERFARRDLAAGASPLAAAPAIGASVRSRRSIGAGSEAGRCRRASWSVGRGDYEPRRGAWSRRTARSCRGPRAPSPS